MESKNLLPIGLKDPWGTKMYLCTELSWGHGTSNLTFNVFHANMWVGNSIHTLTVYTNNHVEDGNDPWR